MIYIDFSHDEIGDTGISHLTNLVRLRNLYLWNTKITDSGLSYLAHLTSLEDLSLAYTKITDEGLSHLAGLTSLRDLDLADTQITAQGLMHLTHLPVLQRVSSSNTQIKNAENVIRTLRIEKQFSSHIQEMDEDMDEGPIESTKPDTVKKICALIDDYLV